MLSRNFGGLPAAMQSEAVRVYYDMLDGKRGALLAKRAFDIVVSLVMLVLLSPVFLAIAVMIKADSKGPVFYRQERVTRNMETFRIFKFRTMVADADKRGPLVTTDGDRRITKAGKRLRNARLDELPQLINVLLGQMSFVGTRPEVKKYVARYNDEMKATLLLPAGVTSTASIRFKDEARQLQAAADAEETYVNTILPQKMVFNLEYLRDFSFFGDLKILFQTLFAVSGQKRENDG